MSESGVGPHGTESPGEVSERTQGQHFTTSQKTRMSRRLQD